jgi:hypothetical protein
MPALLDLTASSSPMVREFQGKRVIGDLKVSYQLLESRSFQIARGQSLVTSGGASTPCQL